MPQPVSLSLCSVLDKRGSNVGAVVIVRDVTEQHLAQATLAEVDARMVEGETLAHIGSWLWDLRTGAVQWSAEFHRIHGVDPLDFDGTFESYLALVHPDDRDPSVPPWWSRSIRDGRSTASTGSSVLREASTWSRCGPNPPSGPPARRWVYGESVRTLQSGSSTASIGTNQAPDLGHQVASHVGHGVLTFNHRGQLPKGASHLGSS